MPDDSLKTKKQLQDEIKHLRDNVVWLENLAAERENTEQLYKSFFDHSVSCCMILDPNTADGIPVIVDANKVACESHGYTRAEFIGRPISDIDDEEGKLMCLERTKQMLLGEALRIEITQVRKDGTAFPVMVFANRVAIGDGLPFIITTEHDITERKQAEDEIHRLAMTDSLTGLANRAQFDQRLRQSVKLANRENKPLALILIDVDRFKLVNDSFGHPVGDSVLKAVASTLTKSTRETDLVARLGGDEFAILFVHPDEEKNAAIKAREIMNKIKFPTKIMDNEMLITTSAGIAFYPRDAGNQEELFKKADQALYEAKDRGRGSFVFYHPKTNGVSVD